MTDLHRSQVTSETLLTQYTTKLLVVLNAIEDSQSEVMRSQIERSRKLFEGVVQSFRYQALTTAVVGVGAGLAGIGAGFAGDKETLKAILEAASRALPQLGQSITTLQQGSQVKTRAEADLTQQQLVSQARSAKEKTDQTRETIVRSIHDIAAAEASAYHGRS